MTFPNFALAQTSVVYGTVTDVVDNKAIPSAILIFQHQDSTFIELKTDFDGFYSYDSLPIGEYSINIKAIGYKPLKIDQLDIDSGGTILLNIEMRQIEFDLDVKEIQWRFISFKDSLGNHWCIDATVNKTDNYGKKQGVWKKYFNDYSDTMSGFKIGQIVWTGFYKDDKKEGEWKYYSPDKEIKRIEIYKDGKLIETK